MRPSTVIPTFLAAALAAAPLAAQAPAGTYRLVRLGADTVPLVVSRGDDGRPLLQLVEETLTLGPGNRALRVTTMRADVYERTPCALLAQLRAAERARAAGDTTPPAPPRDTTAAMCAALRAARDSTPGTVVVEGDTRWLELVPAAGRTAEPRARLVVRGERVEVHAGGVVMTYVRDSRRQ